MSWQGLDLLIVEIALLVLFLRWNLRRQGRLYDAIDEMWNALCRAGWTVHYDFTGLGFGVTARRGEYIIRAEAWTQRGAWRKAIKHARALGLLDLEEKEQKQDGVAEMSQQITTDTQPSSALKMG